MFSDTPNQGYETMDFYTKSRLSIYCTTTYSQYFVTTIKILSIVLDD